VKDWLAHARRERAPASMIAATLACVAVMAALHAAWAVTGADGWLTAFSLLISAFLVAAAALSVALALAARRFFGPGDPLRLVWSVLVAAAVVRLTGHVLSHVVPHWGPLVEMPVTEEMLAAIVRAGRVVSGPLHMALVAVALGSVLRVCRRLGLLVRPTAFDALLVAATALFAAQFLRDLVAWRASAHAPAGVLETITWTSDPLLALLLAEAIVIRRAALAMGASYVSWCWGSFAAAIFLTSVGDVGVWLDARGYVTWPWRSIFWYAWPLAEMAWALGPAWQLVACRSAQRVEMRPRSDDRWAQPAPPVEAIVHRFTPVRGRR